MDRHSSDRIDRFNNLVRFLEVCGRRNLPVSPDTLVRIAGYDEEGRTLESAKTQMQRDIQRLKDDFFSEIEYDKKQKGYIVSSPGKYVLHLYLGGYSERRTSEASSLMKSACRRNIARRIHERSGRV